MRSIAIDPGYNIGWCRSDKKSGTLDLSAYCKNHEGEAIYLFHNFLCDQITAHNIEQVICEAPGFASIQTPSARFVTKIMGIMQEIAFLHDLQFNSYPANQVRKYLIGRGRRLKGETEKQFDKAILAAVHEYGYAPVSEHAADAAGLLIFAQNKGREEGARMGTVTHPHAGAIKEIADEQFR